MDKNASLAPVAGPILTSGPLPFQKETWDTGHGANCLKSAHYPE